MISGCLEFYMIVDLEILKNCPWIEQYLNWTYIMNIMKTETICLYTALFSTISGKSMSLSLIWALDEPILITPAIVMYYSTLPKYHMLSLWDLEFFTCNLWIWSLNVKK